ncbi:MAG: hypothetical protein MZV63_67320 [Marinilabiliales bacterium]|nr:hypothetical protein [Marinilabiliales bacterium]
MHADEVIAGNAMPNVCGVAARRSTATELKNEYSALEAGASLLTVYYLDSAVPCKNWDTVIYSTFVYGDSVRISGRHRAQQQG